MAAVKATQRLVVMAQFSDGSAVDVTRNTRLTSNDDAVARVGISWATDQCRDLLHNNVAGLHFYTLNKSDATRQIYENLGVKDSVALRAG